MYHFSQFLNIVNCHQQLFSDLPITGFIIYMIVRRDPHMTQPNGALSGDNIAKQEDPTADPTAWKSITQKLLNIKKLN